jgi:hypothetical protein
MGPFREMRSGYKVSTWLFHVDKAFSQSVDLAPIGVELACKLSTSRQ